MKKNVLTCVSLCALCLFVWAAQAVNPKSTNLIENDVPHGYDEIVLQGELMYNIGPDDIEAGISDTDVYIQFNQSVGNVSVSLYNVFGVLVYNSVVNTNVQPSMMIPINNAPEGFYYLELETAVGNAEGTFAK